MPSPAAISRTPTSSDFSWMIHASAFSALRTGFLVLFTFYLI
jgi:hypothetical protein